MQHVRNNLASVIGNGEDAYPEKVMNLVMQKIFGRLMLKTLISLLANWEPSVLKRSN